MKIFHHKFAWTNKVEWLLPDKEEMHQSHFAFVDDNISRTLRWIPKRRVCIQAGGAFGLWPLAYAHFFDEVWTWEPHPVNRQCLIANVDAIGTGNIVINEEALSDKRGHANIRYSKPHLNSYGAHWIQPDPQGEVPTVKLDDYDWDFVDHIQLDIEGHELQVLEGADRIIRCFRPVITLEERAFPNRPPPVAVPYLVNQHKYTVVDEFAGDRLLVPAELAL